MFPYPFFLLLWYRFLTGLPPFIKSHDTYLLSIFHYDLYIQPCLIFPEVTRSIRFYCTLILNYPSVTKHLFPCTSQRKLVYLVFPFSPVHPFSSISGLFSIPRLDLVALTSTLLSKVLVKEFTTDWFILYSLLSRQFLFTQDEWWTHVYTCTVIISSLLSFFFPTLAPFVIHMKICTT